MNTSSQVIEEIIFLIAVISLASVSPVQGHSDNFRHPITWSKTYVSGVALSVQMSKNDKSLIVAGNAGYGWAMKTDIEGNPGWSNLYHPTGYLDSSLSGRLTRTKDGGYILAGYSISAGYTSGVDAWLLKLDRGGNPEWSKTCGGPKDDRFLMAQQTPDGGYIAIGNTNLIRCCSSGWVVKTDSGGNVVWQETFVGEDIHSVVATQDGGLLVTGAVEVHNDNAALWVFKLDSEGRMEWQYAYDISQHDSFQVFAASSSAEQTRDGGFIVTAFTGRAGLLNSPQPRQAMFLRLDSDGRILWQEMYGDGIGESEPSSVRETEEGGFIATGFSRPSYFDGKLAGVGGPWLLRLSKSGDIIWQKIYSVTNDQLLDAQETRDNGFVAVGFTQDSTWVLKTDAMGTVRGCEIGVPANMTLVEGNAVLVEPMPPIEATPTHAKINETQVVVMPAQVLPMVQCMLTEIGDISKD